MIVEEEIKASISEYLQKLLPYQLLTIEGDEEDRTAAITYSSDIIRR